MTYVANSGCDEVWYTASSMDSERTDEPETKGLERRLFFSRRGRIQARMADCDPVFKQWLVALNQERFDT